MGDLLSDLEAGNAAWVRRLKPHELVKQPARRAAVVTCMDSRIDAMAIFGFVLGDTHIIRNAGAVVTDDVERSVLLSQYAMGTRSILVVGHTDCGLLGHDEEATHQLVERERGRRPTYPLGSITSAVEGVQASVRRLRQSPYLHHTDDVHGFVYDVATGGLTPVD